MLARAILYRVHLPKPLIGVRPVRHGLWKYASNCYSTTATSEGEGDGNKEDQGVHLSWVGVRATWDDHNQMQGLEWAADKLPILREQKQERVQANTPSRDDETEELYYALVEGYIRVGDISTATHYMNLMIQDGISPSLLLWNRVIRHHGHPDFVDGVSSLYGLIPKVGLQHRLSTHTALLEALLLGNKMQDALELFRNPSLSLSERAPKCVLDQLVGACVKHTLWNDAIDVVDCMKKRNIDVGLACDTIIDMSMQHGSLDLGWDTYVDMKTKARPSATVVGSMLRGFSEEPSSERLVDIVDAFFLNDGSMPLSEHGVKDIPADLLDDAMETMLAIGEGGKAASVFLTARSKDPPVYTITRAESILEDIVQKMETKGQALPIGAKATFLVDIGLEMDQSANTSRIFQYLSKGEGEINSLSQERLEGLVLSLCRGTHVDEALQVYHCMKSAGFVPSASLAATLVAANVSGSVYHGAEAVYEDMVKMKVERSPSVYASMIAAYGATQQIEKAQSLYDDMLKTGVKPDPTTCAALLTTFLMSGKLGRAWDIYQDMRSKKMQLAPETCNVLIKELASGEEVQKAFGVLQDMKHDKVWADDEAYRMLISIFVEKKDTENAVKLSWELKDLQTKKKRSK